MKIEPGHDVEPVRAVRERFGDILFQVDANAAYTRDDAHHLAELDAFDLLLIEQPLPEDDIVGHAELARVVTTPICLDESITSARGAEDAIALGACRIVNIKAGRVGGYLEAKRVHDVCAAANVPVWCGGMLETALGRAANVALAALPNFTLPGDTSASGRYYAEDICEPFVLDDGRLPVPAGPGSVSRRSRTSSNGSRRSSRCVDREQAKLQLEHDSLVRVFQVELEQLDQAAHPVTERIRVDRDALGRPRHVAEAVEVGAKRRRVRPFVLRVVCEHALELSTLKARMIEAQLLQLVQHDLASHVLDRRDGARERVGSQHAEDAFRLPPGRRHLPDALGGRPHRDE